MVNRRIRLSAFLIAALCITNMSACSQQSTSTTSSVAANQTSSLASSETSSESTDQSIIYGKVTAIDGSKITLALGTIKDGKENAKGGKQPQNDASSGSEKASAPSGKNNGSAPSDNGAPPSGNNGGNNAGHQSMDLLTLSGETSTITVSDTSIIKKQSMEKPDKSSQADKNSSTSSNSSASLSDIKVGTILSISKDSSGTLSAITILGGSGGPNSNENSSQK